MTRRLWVAKIGGRPCEAPSVLARFAAACASTRRPLVVIHGGGDGVTRVQAALGIEPRFVEGRRVTDPASMEAVEMVLSGAINKSIVRALGRAGRPALGVSGCDAGMTRCHPAEGLGRVGTPAVVDTHLLTLALDAGLTPVVSPVSLGHDGEAVNVNADDFAAAVAAALRAGRLLLLSDVEGVRVETSWRESIAPEEVETLIARGEIAGGMIPKMRAAALAVASGVGEVRIGVCPDGHLGSTAGTAIRTRKPGRLRAARRAFERLFARRGPLGEGAGA